MSDYQYVNLSGVILPDTSNILTEVENEYKSAFGSDLIVTPDTPQGVLITAETLSRDAVVRNNAALANQINPNIAGGVFLDAICALSGLQRDAATKTVVTATIAGVPATLIPAGSRAQTPQNNVFETTGDFTIGGGGTVSATFQAVEFGPIPCPIGELSQIVDAVTGWETVTNPGAGTLGTNTQSDVSLRTLRRLTLAGQGTALPEAIISAVYKVPEVKSMTFRENIEASSETIDGVLMVAHSIYCCVDGGTDEDVATAILSKKSLGANYNGAETVNVVDAASGQTYAVKFDRPTEVPIEIRTTVKNTDALVDPVVACRTAILAFVNGEIEGEAGWTVGTSVSTFELAGAINRLYPGIYVQSLETSDDGGSTWGFVEIPISISQKATTISSDITVTVA